MKKYIVIYEKVLKKEMEAENHFDALNKAHEQRPEGYKIKDFYIPDNEEVSHEN